MKEQILEKYNKIKNRKLITSIVIDLVGLASFMLPSLGEWGDAVWAPISGFLIYTMFPNRKKMALLGVLEEAIPFIDFVPTAYLTWRQEYIKDKEKTLADFINKEVADKKTTDDILDETLKNQLK